MFFFQTDIYIFIARTTEQVYVECELQSRKGSEKNSMKTLYS